MIIAIDTNVISALWGREPGWQGLIERLNEFSSTGTLVFSPVVPTELHAHPLFSRAILGMLMDRARINVPPMTEPMWALAGERYAGYAARRRAGAAGEPRRVAADFMVGAHAALSADALMTNDPRVYKVNFPELELV